MVRSPIDGSNGLKKGPWTPEEDDKLIEYVRKHDHGSWRALPKLAGLNRCGKSCRLRWTNYLRPDIKRGKFSQEEEETILNLHSVLGNKWSAIATHLPGRTDNEIKNFWNTHLRKKLVQMGLDPMTHQPRTDIFSSLPHLIALANSPLLTELVKLQCLINNFNEIDTYNLANSVLSNHNGNTSLQGVMNTNNDTFVPFSHLPDLQIIPDINYQTPGVLFDQDHQDIANDHRVIGLSNEGQNTSSSSTLPLDPTTSVWSDQFLQNTFFDDII